MKKALNGIMADSMILGLLICDCVLLGFFNEHDRTGIILLIMCFIFSAMFIYRIWMSLIFIKNQKEERNKIL